jgi:hypothetical protein
MISKNEFQAIANLDLDPIKVKLMHKESGEGWSLDYVNMIEHEYRRFLYLVKMYPHEPVAPMFDVDIFWHYHILDTMKYAADCDSLFGYFLHHFPYVGLRGDDDQATREHVGERMQKLYKETFGESYLGRQTGNPAEPGAGSRPAAGLSQNSAYCYVTANGTQARARQPAYCYIAATKASASDRQTAYCYVSNGAAVSSQKAAYCYVAADGVAARQETAYCYVTAEGASVASKKASYCYVVSGAATASRQKPAYCYIVAKGDGPRAQTLSYCYDANTPAEVGLPKHGYERPALAMT